ncbi:digestive organ expansion factor-like protein [Cladochytrium replicatum]|nr:digestive organ expansion factor-like protein [Cladochytrium replicatum]
MRGIDGDDWDSEDDEPEVDDAIDDQAQEIDAASSGSTSTDPFRTHFNLSTDEIQQKSKLVDSRSWTSTSQTVAPEGLPGSHQWSITHSILSSDSAKSESIFDTSVVPFSSFNIKQRLHDTWNAAHRVKGVQKQAELLQTHLFKLMNTYVDVMYTEQSLKDEQAIMETYCLHVLNHVYKARDRITKNNETLKKAKEGGREASDCQDQGFTRPRVLILLPFKNSAFDVINTLVTLSGSKQQDNKKRFMDEFSGDDDEMDPTKPEDYKRTFRGNIDDSFRIGIQFSRTNMKLYAPFYKSDVIIASPLGLRMIIGAEGDRKREFDFLSSIEVVVVDQAHVLLMQNWEHFLHVFEHMNRIPKEMHDCDFSRIRPYVLDGRLKYLRQNLVFSHYLTPELNSLFNGFSESNSPWCANIAGKWRVRCAKVVGGSIGNVVVQVPQTFHRVGCTSVADADDARFQFFIDKVLPTFQQSVAVNRHTLLFVPSYFDFVRLRNYLDKLELNFTYISEYTANSDISRARTEMFQGTADFMLLTERFHFFRRYRVRGIQHIFFYGLPENAHFYPELVHLLSDTRDRDQSKLSSPTITALFTRYDRLVLERIVGTKRMVRMCEGDKEVFMFS